MARFRVDRSLLIGSLMSVLALVPEAVGQAPAQDAVAGAELDAVIEVIHASIKEAQRNDINGFPKLKSAKVSLQTIAESKGGLVVRFLVFTIGAKRQTQTTSELTLEMVPPPSVAPQGFAPIDPTQLRLSLARAINLAKAGTVAAQRGDSPLKMKEVTIGLKFAVKTEGSAGAEKVQLLPIGVDATAGIGKERIHTLTLVFG